MATTAAVLKHSVSPQGVHLFTLLVTFPRIVLSEANTHRMLQRNYASTRAIPLATQIHNLLVDPFIPEKFGVNQPGMQSYSHLSGYRHDQAVEIWLAGRDRAITTVLELELGRDGASELLGYEPSRDYVNGNVLLERFDDIKAALPKSTDEVDPLSGALNVHKQLAGRNLETWMWAEGIITATEFDNFFALRDHPAAQGEIAQLARAMRLVMDNSEPQPLQPGEWHLPLVDDGEFDDIEQAIQSSAARCAAVSYRRHTAKNPEKEFARYRQLLEGGHMSPFEHQATPLSEEEIAMRELMAKASREAGPILGLRPLFVEQAAAASDFCGPLRGWRSHRKHIETEANFALARKE